MYKMPYFNKNKAYRGYSPPPVSKKIFIEQTTVLLIVGFAIFKAVAFLWSQDAILPSTLLESLSSLPNVLRTYPAFAGALLSFMTWHVMYFDSAAPGINPPSPLSPAKHRVASGANFHLNYLFAMAVGVMLTAFLYVGLV